MSLTDKEIVNILDKAIEAKRELRTEKEREALVTKVAGDLVKLLTPLFEKIGENAKSTASDIAKAIKGLDIGEPKVTVTVPDIHIPEIKVPKAEVTVHIPEIRVPRPEVTVNVPQIKVPDINMPERIQAILDYTYQHPLPVIMIDQTGVPMQMSSQGGASGGSFAGGGGKGDFYTIVDIRGSSASIIDQTEGALRVTGNFTVSGSASSTYAQLVNSDNLPYSSDNPLPITGSLSTTPGATFYASDAVGSTNVIQLGGNNIALNNGVVGPGVQRFVHVTDAEVSTVVNSFLTSLEIKQVSGFADSVFVIGSSGTTVVVGDTVSDAADSGSAPQKIGGIARTANPTAVADGDRVAASFDAIGRQVIRPLQVRGLLATAYVTLSTGTETTLLASASGVFSDLIYIAGANTSTAAVQVDIRDGTGGGVVLSLYIPANSTAGLSLPTPIPQNVAAQTWTVDMGDFTNSNVLISALFSKEV